MMSEHRRRLWAHTATRRASTPSFLVEEIEPDLLAQTVLAAGSERHDGVARSARPSPDPAANSARLQSFFLTTRQSPLDRSRMNDDTEALGDATDQIG